MAFQNLILQAADLPAISRRHGAKIIESNPVESAISAPTGETLPLVLAALDA